MIRWRRAHLDPVRRDAALFHYLDTQKVGNGTVPDIATRAFANLLTAAGKKSNVCVVVSDLAATYDTGTRLINRALEDARQELQLLFRVESVRMLSMRRRSRRARWCPVRAAENACRFQPNARPTSDQVANQPCPQCGIMLGLVRRLHGKNVRCKNCGAALAVSADPWALYLVNGASASPAGHGAAKAFSGISNGASPPSDASARPQAAIAMNLPAGIPPMPEPGNSPEPLGNPLEFSEQCSAPRNAQGGWRNRVWADAQTARS